MLQNQRLCDRSPVRFLLESVTGGEQVSRYSFMGSGPRAIYRLYADRLEEQRHGLERSLPGPPLEALRKVLGSVRCERRELPFEGGFVGPLDLNDSFGRAVVSLGDLDGDGVADLAVGAVNPLGNSNPEIASEFVWLLFMLSV